MKKRKQLSLPFYYDEKLKGHVKQSKKLTFSYQDKMSVYSKRILNRVFAEIKNENNSEEEFNDFKFYYRFHVSEITNETSRSGVYSRVKKAIDELMLVFIRIEDEENKKYTPKHFVDTRENFGYHNGWINFYLNPALKKELVNLGKVYTTYELEDYLTFNSWEEMRFYELISAFRTQPDYTCSEVYLREHLHYVNSYKKTADFEKKVLEKFQKRFENTDVAFDIVKIYEERELGQRGRPKVKSFKFVYKKRKHGNTKLINHWRENNPQFSDVYTKLKEFKVHDYNISEYSKYIKIKGMKELVRQWQIKESSSKRIENKEAYCNTVFRETGKRLKKEMEDNID